jgi:voltage-gated potassium channel
MGHWITEMVVAVLIVISVVLVVVEAGLSPQHRYFEAVVFSNDVITGLFVVELTLRFIGEKTKSRFFRTYWYDILAVLPLLRGVRLLRVLRLLRLFRFGVIAIRRLSRVSRLFRLVRVEYVIIGLIAVTVVLMGGLSIRYADPSLSSVGEALWFSLMTLIAGEPIGAQPATPLGRVVTVTIMIGGLTVFAVLTGTVSAVMIDTLRQMKLRPIAMEDLEDHVVVCGWNQAGRLIVEELLNDEERFPHIVVITETDEVEEEPVIQSHPGEVFTMQGDFTRMDVLTTAGIERASHALLLADESVEERTSQDRDARTVLAAMLIEKLNTEIYSTVQLLNRDNDTSLRQIGVEEIIVSDEYVGNIMATVTRHRGIVSMLDELLTSKWGHQFFKDSIPADIVGLEVNEAIGILKEDYDATLLGVDTKDPSAGHKVLVNPPGDLVLKPEHELFIAGSRRLTDPRDRD